MKYKNGKDILPPDLLQRLQHYIHGEMMYVPKKQGKRAGWGEINGTQRSMARRNEEIYVRYYSGCSIIDLVETYHLSEDSIRKIILKIRGQKAIK